MESYRKVRPGRDYHSAYCDYSSTSAERNALLKYIRAENQTALLSIYEYSTGHQRVYDHGLTQPVVRQCFLAVDASVHFIDARYAVTRYPL